MTDLMYGKRAPKGAEALLFAKYRTPSVMPIFPADDYAAGIDWSATMNGNDRAGDCVSCALANAVLLISTLLGGLPVKASLDEVLAFYRTQNPGFDINGTAETNGPGSSHDGGMDEQTALEELVRNGITIGGKVYKALGFAKVDHNNLAEIKAAVSIFGSLLLGVQVAQAQQTQFPGTWDYVAGSPIEGGHAIIAGGHRDVASNDIPGVCWASEFATTDLFLSKQLDEAWAILWPWHLLSKQFIAGMDLATFAADYTTITGKPFPVAVTPAPPIPVPPAPVNPVPAPDPAQAVITFYDNAKFWAHGRHVGANAAAARAALALFKAEGLE